MIVSRGMHNALHAELYLASLSSRFERHLRWRNHQLLVGVGGCSEGPPSVMVFVHFLALSAGI